MKVRDWLIVISLAVASVATTVLVGMRGAYYGELRFTFLVWNLFLAWIPLGVAGLVRLRPLPLWVLLPLSSIWFIFLPNAPYILTDLVHIRRFDDRGLWLDIIIVLLAALVGLFAGFTSLNWMQREFEERWGAASGWLLALSALFASGFGVYIGRFLRWNSWDLFTRPTLLLPHVRDVLTSPGSSFHAISYSMLFSFIFLFVYLMMQINRN